MDMKKLGESWGTQDPPSWSTISQIVYWLVRDHDSSLVAEVRKDTKLPNTRI